MSWNSEMASVAKRYAEMIQAMIGQNVAAPYPQKVGYNLARLVAEQQSSGAFLPEDASVHPEMRWFEELVILHAVANVAVRSGDVVYQAAVRKSAEFHLGEIQPDHATSDPWGLLAFIQYALPLADQVLHGVRLHYPVEVAGTALWLLQDVLYGLQILIAKET